MVTQCRIMSDTYIPRLDTGFEPSSLADADTDYEPSCSEVVHEARQHLAAEPPRVDAAAQALQDHLRQEVICDDPDVRFALAAVQRRQGRLREAASSVIRAVRLTLDVGRGPMPGQASDPAEHPLDRLSV